MLLLFVYVFGGALNASLRGTLNRASRYIDYIVPGIILMTLGSGSMPTAVAVCSDMSEGIMARFRTMAIARVSVLTGHVIGSVIKTMISTGLVIGVAVLMGYRSTAGPVAWVAVVGVIAMVSFALTWLAVALGLASRTPGAAGRGPLVRREPAVHAHDRNDSNSANGHPERPRRDPHRRLSAGLALAGYLWAKKLYNRDPIC